jgi:hypothetical protein
VQDFHPQFELVHLRNANHLDLDIGEEVAVVGWVPDECDHLLLQGVDIFERGIEGAEDRYLFSHGLASRDVLYPQTVEDDVRYLYCLAVANALEDCV